MNISETYIRGLFEQIKINPYIEELKDKIQSEKKKNLEKIWGKEIVLTNTKINIIFDCIYCIDDLELIKKNLHRFTEDSHFEYDIKKLISDNYIFSPTPLRISTMTIISYLGIDIDTNVIFDNFIPPDVDSHKDILNKFNGSVVGAKIKNHIKGFFVKKQDVSQVFFNSATLNILINNKFINAKIFNNGKIQMTGVNSEENAVKAVQIIKKILNTNNNAALKDVNSIISNDTEFKTVLINSDYDCKFEIQREKLNYLLINNYGLSVSYEPENYPGVKIAYFWNKLNNINKTGICSCNTKCTGKVTGVTENSCKKVTVAIFQSGKIIITGGNSTEQINDAYAFINNILSTNIFYIKKKYSVKYYENDIKKKKKKNILIKKTDIINLNLYNMLTNTI